jgi:hypothetical protein
LADGFRRLAGKHVAGVPFEKLTLEVKDERRLGSAGSGRNGSESRAEGEVGRRLQKIGRSCRGDAAVLTFPELVRRSSKSLPEDQALAELRSTCDDEALSHFRRGGIPLRMKENGWCGKG